MAADRIHLEATVLVGESVFRRHSLHSQRAAKVEPQPELRDELERQLRRHLSDGMDFVRKRLRQSLRNISTSITDQHRRQKLRHVPRLNRLALELLLLRSLTSWLVSADPSSPRSLFYTCYRFVLGFSYC